MPSTYKPKKNIANLGISKNIFNNKLSDLNVFNILRKVNIMNNYNNLIINKFDIFRGKEMKLSRQVDENTLVALLNNYSTIIVGSDQVWNPSQRKSPIYFLDFKDKYKGKKISYAADSTVKDVNSEGLDKLKSSLCEFDHISVRNKHSLDLSKALWAKPNRLGDSPLVQ